MGFTSPTLPDVDLGVWRTWPFRDRLRLMSLHWAEYGFGTPTVLLLVYLAKITIYSVGGLWLVSATTPSIGGLADLSQWWSLPIVFQKLVVFTLLWEVLGLGCGFGALTGHFRPPMGGALYWLRPGTIRLPPWPSRVPFTAGDRRSVIDVALYIMLLASAVRVIGATEVTPSLLAPIAVLVPLLGLRDRALFLAARAEHYWVTVVVLLFAGDALAGAKVVMWVIWWGAATSKLNRHFPSVVATMMSNSPLMRSKRIRRTMYRNFPDDLRPSRVAASLAHLGTAVEYSVPLILVTTGSGRVHTVAVAIMVLFHLHILSTIPMGVPLEWNIFFVFATLSLFGAHADVSVFSIDSPLLIVLLAIGVLLGPVLGNLRPDLVSFLPAMRYYAGNWAVSMWLYRPEALEKVDECVTKSAPILEKQLGHFYEDDTGQAVGGKGLAFRASHVAGRGVIALIPRAVDNVEDYVVHDGEAEAGVLIGYNFGDGHLHDQRLLASLQQRCQFSSGDLRCIFFESQPLGRPVHHWRIYDAADGLIDEGYMAVDDLVAQQPWLNGDGLVPAGSIRRADVPTPPWPSEPSADNAQRAETSDT